MSQAQQEVQGLLLIFDTGWSHWIEYLVKEGMMKVSRPGPNNLVLVDSSQIVPDKNPPVMVQSDNRRPGSGRNSTHCGKRVTWWRHRIETFSALLATCAGNSLVTGEVPHNGQWRRAPMFSLMCACTKGWVNNPDAGGLRRHPAHYDVTVMNHVWVTKFRQVGGHEKRQGHRADNFVALVRCPQIHHSGVIIGAMASPITSLTIVYSTVYSDADHRKYQRSALGIKWADVTYTQKGSVKQHRKFDHSKWAVGLEDLINLSYTTTVAYL